MPESDARSVAAGLKKKRKKGGKANILTVLAHCLILKRVGGHVVLTKLLLWFYLPPFCEEEDHIKALVDKDMLVLTKF